MKKLGYILLGTLMLFISACGSPFSCEGHKFKEGDLVRHVTGGPLMSIASCFADSSLVNAEWIDNRGEMQTQLISEKNLRPAELPSAERMPQ